MYTEQYYKKTGATNVTPVLVRLLFKVIMQPMQNPSRKLQPKQR